MYAKKVVVQNKEKGITFFGLLTVAFIVLKLLGKIDWSWAWVLAPLWIPAAFILSIITIVIIVVVVRS